MSLPINTSSLVMELRSTLTEIDRQIEAAKRSIRQSLPVQIEPSEAMYYGAKYPDGKFILADLLVAKSQCLSAIANLKQRPTIINKPGPKR